MKKIVISIILLFCVGCGRPFQVNINSISSGKILSGSKCVILPLDPNIVTDQLQYQEYSSYIKRALEKKGYEVTDNGRESKIVVFLNYGISDPHESIYSYNTPVWGQTGISSSYTTGTINSYGSGMASYSGKTTYTPQYGITGYQTNVGTMITFTRFLVLDAYDLDEYRKTNNAVQLWRTTAISTGSSGDLRFVFPIIVAASAEYMGTDTGKQIEISIYENDKRIKEIKGLLGK
ncbi:MAG: hypothetical protein ABSH16_07650 [Sedimentisphaerales bacterium]